MRNVGSFTSFSTQTRWKESKPTPGPLDYAQPESVFTRASRARLHPLFNREESPNRKPLPKMSSSIVLPKPDKRFKSINFGKASKESELVN